MKRIFIYSLVFCMVLLSTCEKPERVALIQTGQPTGIETNRASITGRVVDAGDGIEQHGHYWSESSNPFNSFSKTSKGSVNIAGNFTSEITNLEPGTTYYVRAYAISNGETVYGDQATFRTLQTPTATTNAATNISETTATLNGTVNANGQSTTVTFEYGLTTSYGSTVTATQSPVTGTVNAYVSATISGLSPGTTYHFRVKAVSTAGTTYGSDLTFTTLALNPPEATTNAATDITETTATLNGTVNAHGQSTTVTFEYGTTMSYGSSVTAVQSPVTGTVNTSVSATISGLTPGTTYHFLVVAVNASDTTPGSDMTFTTDVYASECGTVTDYDGNEYNTVQIGNQCWMKENLKTTRYADGTSIPLVEGTSAWDALGYTDKAYCYYENSTANRDVYGALYTWAAAMNGAASSSTNPSGVQGVCPNGWHLPSDAEWTELTDYLGGESAAGGKLKEVGTEHWYSPNTGADNSSGFTALPGGLRYVDGSFSNRGFWSNLWTSTIDHSPYTYYRRLDYDNSEVIRTYLTYLNWGFSVRCLKDGAPLLPSAMTNEATYKTETSATLNGTVNANGQSTTVTFEYGLTTSYGSTITAVQSPVTGTVNTNVSAIISGLMANTTYHFRVVAVNASGTTHGSDMTFTTLTSPNPPNATTNEATDVTETTATLNGTVNANGQSTTITFEYGTTTSYGSIATVSWPVVGNTNTGVSVTITGLTPGTTYHFRVVAVNASGTTHGSDMTFTTLTSPNPPNATTNEATDVTETEATLNGTVNANGQSTTVTFEYGLTTSYGSTVTATQSPVTGSVNTNVSANISGLAANTTYHFRVVAVNASGTNPGSDLTFTTSALEPPVAITNAATDKTETTATLNGTVNANGQNTTVTFEYGTTTGYGSTVTAVQSPVTGNTNTNVSANISGLTPGTTYHFRVVAVNASGTTYGSDLTFTTDAEQLPCGTGTITDYDGNTYNMVQIGSQCWMKENLKVTHYSDGTSIPLVEGTSAWDALGYTDKAYCYYNNSTAHRDIYGALYTWAAAMNGVASSSANPSGVQGVCPVGWHLPSDAEWKELEMYLGMSQAEADDTGWRGSDEGGKLKETGTLHWISPNTGATNSSGFTALPGGYRHLDGSFLNVGNLATFWSSTEYDSGYAWFRGLDYDNSEVYRSWGEIGKDSGFSVRCLRD